MFEDATELLRKIREGVGPVLMLSAVDFRPSGVVRPKPEDLADELAAMANTRDGILVLGVDDKTREIRGIPIEKLDDVERLVQQAANDSITPPLQFETVRMELPDELGEKRPILKIDVPRSLFVHRSPGGYFHRQGGSKRPLPPDLLARLFQQRSQTRLIRFEEEPVPRTSFASLNEDLWRPFVGRQGQDPRGTLHKMQLLAMDASGVERATVAGVLMCSHEPQIWLRSATIEAVRYRGKAQDSNYQTDAKTLTGPLPEQILGAMSFVRRNMTVAATKAPGRQEVPQFSLRAVFEAVVNAVAHRDYSVAGSRIRLFLFDDRLELYSPGPLPNTLTIESLPLRQSSRNELLTFLLARSSVGDLTREVERQFFMERRGDGVPIILSESRKLSGREPVYRLLDDSELMLTIWSAKLPNQPREA